MELASCQARGVRFQAASGKLLVWLNTVARYLAVDGREILVQPAADALMEDVQALLLCSPMGALLHQRGMLPLRGSTVATPWGGVVFAGYTGHGKSTLAAYFRQLGFGVLADDIAAVTFNSEGQPMVAAGAPHFKLWSDSVAALGHQPDSLPRFRPQLDKRRLAFGDAFQGKAMPLARIYMLERRHDVRGAELTELSLTDKLRYLLTHTYRARFLPGLGMQQAHFQKLGRLAGAVPIKRLAREDAGTFRLNRLAELVTADLNT